MNQIISIPNDQIHCKPKNTNTSKYKYIKMTSSSLNVHKSHL